MKQIVLIFLFLSFGMGLYAATVKGRISSEKEPIAFAEITVSGTKSGAISDEKGYFIIEGIEPGRYLLLVKAFDFLPDSLMIEVKDDSANTYNFELKKSETDLDVVTITATMKEVSVSESPVHIDVITPKLFEKNPSASIFESLSMVNGVRPQLQCNVCSTGDIHINGMEGPYTMVMIDGMPIVSALGTVYGLMGIPNSIIQRVEIQKGPASTLYGSEAVGGLINVITKSPDKSSRVYFDAFGTSYEDLNVDLGVRYKIGNKIDAILSTNMFYFTKRWDVNQDNFTDITLQKRFAVYNKYTLKHASGKASQLGIRYYYEDRWGGEMQWNPSFRGGDSIYGESIYTNRLEVIGVSPLLIAKQAFRLQYSVNKHLQNSAYGSTSFHADQVIAFGQLLKNIELNRQEILIGAAVRYTFYDDNTIITQSSDSLNPENRPTKTFLPGIFVQDEIQLNEKNVLLTGIRYDYNTLHGSILSPRVNWKSTINKNNTLRLGIGNGYRVVNLFSEDHAAFNGSREVVILSNLKPEQSWSSNLNYTFLKQFPKMVVSADFNLFYTYFMNKIVADYFTDHSKVIFDNLNGYGINRGAGAHILCTFNFPLKVAVGGTYTDIYLLRRDQQGTEYKTRQIQTPAFTSNFVLTYSFSKINSFVDISGNCYSPMLLPVLPNDFRAANSPWFCLLNIQFTKEIQNWQLYAGCKNLLNFFPKEAPIMRPFDPFDKTANDPVSNPNGYNFDTGYNYAPLQKARVFLGVRFKIK